MEVVEKEEEEEAVAVADEEYCGETQQQLHNRRQRLRNRLKLAVIATAEREGLCPDFSSFKFFLAESLSLGFLSIVIPFLERD
jgi:hypothetical protein